MTTIDTDYLIVGAGAVGLAFADTLLSEDPDCHISIIDTHAKPGGHWNDAYSFVALHQPSATYGVNSMTFPSEQIDQFGPNKGMHALASGSEVLAYFEKVMNLTLLPSGRVNYYPLTRYVARDEAGIATISGVLSGSETRINVRRKLVDATFYQTSVPSTHTPNFQCGSEVSLVPPGKLPELWKATDNLPDHYVVLGAGKTAMDTVIWLLQADIDPDHISWVRPRESWMWNRAFVQPGEDFFEAVIEMQIAILEAADQANDSAELMRILGNQGYYLRVDPDVEPEMFHYAIISEGEIELLRRVKRVIRAGRVTAIEPGLLHCEKDDVAVPANALFIDCTASAVPFSVRDKNNGPIFRGDNIVLQPLQVPLVVFSAAIAAFIEANFDDDETRNALATPGPLTDSPSTFAYAHLVNMMNRGAWSKHPEMMKFLAGSRLDLTTGTIAKLAAENSPKMAMMGKFKTTVERCMPAVITLGMQAKELHEAT